MTRAVPSGDAKRFLFVLRGTAHFPLFESVTRQLCEDGHFVDVLVDPRYTTKQSTKNPKHLLDLCKRDLSGFEHGPYVKRNDPWARAAFFGRDLRNYVNSIGPNRASSTFYQERWLESFPVFWRRPMATTVGKRLLLSSPFRGFLSTLERKEPPHPSILQHLQHRKPDVVIASPGLLPRAHELEYLKAAKSLGIPTVLAVASWDNLTTKGTFHVMPDRVLVWNAVQIKEAVKLHGVEKSRLLATGAPRFDPWFDLRVKQSREELCREIGIDPAVPFALYLSSSQTITEDETGLVTRFWQALQSEAAAAGTRMNLVVRPHPRHGEIWDQVTDQEGFVVWPRGGELAIDGSSQQRFYDGLFHSVGVVGVNTSAFLEAAIVDKPCISLIADEFRMTQSDTLHFQYLLDGGFLEVTPGLKEAANALLRCAAGADALAKQRRAFVQEFLRPEGIGVPATKIFAAELERFATAHPVPWSGTSISGPIEMDDGGLEDGRLRAAARLGKAERTQAKMDDHAAAARRWSARAAGPRGTVLGVAARLTRGSVAQVAQDASHQRVLAQVRQLTRGRGPIVMGPWISDVGSEVLYWIPFLRWIVDQFGVDPGRVTVISRGGVHAWYEGISEHYVDAFDLVSLRSFQAWDARQLRRDEKAWTQSKIEAETLQLGCKAQGLRRPSVLHPGLADSLFRAFRTGNAPMTLVENFTRIRRLRMPATSLELPHVPYVAAKFYNSRGLPLNQETAVQSEQLVSRVAKRTPVVILESGFVLSRQRAFNMPTGDQIFRAGSIGRASQNLAVQAGALSRAAGFLGSPGGFAALASSLGVNAVTIRSASHPSPPDARWLQHVSNAPGMGRVTELDLQSRAVETLFAGARTRRTEAREPLLPAG